MYIEQKVKCKKCGLENTLNNKEWVKCPNRCYEIKFGECSYSYKTEDGMSDCIEYDYKDCKKLIEDGDYLEVDGEFIELMNKAKEFKDKDWKIRSYDYYEKDSYGNKKLRSFEIELFDIDKNNQHTELTLYLHFENRYDSVKNSNIEEYKERLRRFLDIVEQYLEGSLDLNDRARIEELEDIRDVSKTQVELYDMKYYF